MPTQWFGDADVSENEEKDDLSSLNLDADESDENEHFVPPSERPGNREIAEYERSEEEREYREAKPLSESSESSDDETDDAIDDEIDVGHWGKNYSTKYHSAVFPGMQIPAASQKQAKKYQRQRRGIVETSRDAYVPVMSVQCPLPGGNVVSTVTDPVQKVSWGPLTRIEASKEARDLVKEWKQEIRRHVQSGRQSTNRTNKEKQPALDKSISHPPADHHPDDKRKEYTTPEEATPSTSQAETDAANSKIRMLKPPPPTPPDAIFRPAMSMPTLPNFHRISDPALVEQYRLQRAIDPEEFDKETRAIKRGLFEAKVARGGKGRLLKNEYTVELASRQDAAIAEKWTSARLVQMRSRGNTLNIPPLETVEEVKIRGGEVEGLSKSDEVVQTTETIPDDGNVSQAAPKTPNTKGTKSRQSSQSDRRSIKSHRRELKSRFQSMDLPSHVSKITTSGSVRHQHTEKREVSDYGEKRTVTTWIQIEEVYEVPAPSALSWKDVLTAVEGGENTDGGYFGAKETTNHKKKRVRRHSGVTKTRKRDTESGSSDSNSDHGSFCSETVKSRGRTHTENLLDHIARSGMVNNEELGRVAESLRRIIATLGENDALTVEEEY